MSTLLQSVIDGYGAWVQSGTDVCMADAHWLAITLPFRDRHNDYLVVYARRDEETVTLSDNGECLADLATAGWAWGAPRAHAVLTSIVRGLGLESSMARSPSPRR